jgi:hypothetical protein
VPVRPTLFEGQVGDDMAGLQEVVIVEQCFHPLTSCVHALAEKAELKLMSLAVKGRACP